MKIVKYYTPSCNPCKQLNSVVAALHLKFDQEVNLEDNPEDARNNKIKAVPTIIKYDDTGKEINRIIGLTSAACLREFFQQEKKHEIDDEIPF